jgi:rubrerythrin
MTTTIWEIDKNRWECNSCYCVFQTREPQRYKKCPFCGEPIEGRFENVTDKFINDNLEG